MKQEKQKHNGREAQRQKQKRDVTRRGEMLDRYSRRTWNT